MNQTLAHRTISDGSKSVKEYARRRALLVPSNSRSSAALLSFRREPGEESWIYFLKRFLKELLTERQRIPISGQYCRCQLRFAGDNCVDIVAHQLLKILVGKSVGVDG